MWATSLRGGIFAGIYLGEEVLLRLLSSLIIHVGYSWVVVFVLYTLIVIGAALLMFFSVECLPTDEERIKNAAQSSYIVRVLSPFDCWYRIPRLSI